jgi:hypothetical protein
MEEDVSVLQQEQNNLTVQFSQRKDLKRKIEVCSLNLYYCFYIILKIEHGFISLLLQI